MNVLILIPAHNEVETLSAVIREVRNDVPALPILVVDDASTDGTGELLPELDVRWLQLSQHLGIGGAMRAGLRFARFEGFDTVVRLDADGQHRAAEIPDLLDLLETENVDAVVGSRFHGAHGFRTRGALRGAQWALGRFLSLVTGSQVTDPTSGFWVFGAEALKLLGDHYPRGYSEPELYLFLQCNALVVREIGVTMRSRQGGRSTLTPTRSAISLVRVAINMVVVPLRRMVRRHTDV